MTSTLRRAAAFGAALALTAAIPAAAHAATLNNADGTLTYTGGDAATCVYFSQVDPTINTVRVVDLSADDAISSSTGCVPIDADPGAYDCPAVDARRGQREAAETTYSQQRLFQPTHPGGPASTGSCGDARRVDRDGDDTLYDGDGADVLDGGAGDDNLTVGGWADVLTGGTGIDSASYSVVAPPAATAAPAVSVSLDGVANDGIAGEGDNFGADIEDLNYVSSSFDPDGPGGAPTQYGSVTLTGSAAANSLSVDEGDVGDSAGNANITGGNGNDVLTGGIGNDRIDARDGFADRVSCAGGTDTVTADTLDQVSSSCENISTADVGNATEDKPPTLSWAAPASGATLSGNTPTTLQVNAADDKAVTQVQFLDDDRVVCTDTVAPYTCTYQARGADVGRNTLVAVASDALGQTASSVRPVVVSRFSATSLSLKASPTKDKKGPYRFTISGKLTLPASVTPVLGCGGNAVTVTVKGGSRTLSSRSAKLSSTCTYKIKVTFKGRSGFPRNGKLKIKASSAGNDVVSAKASSTKTVSTK